MIYRIEICWQSELVLSMGHGIGIFSKLIKPMILNEFIKSWKRIHGSNMSTANRARIEPTGMKKEKNKVRSIATL